MDEENLWGVCEHILRGSANEIRLRRNKIALCKRCAVEFSPERFQSVYESQLRDLIEDIDVVDGMEHLDKKE